VTTLRNPTQRIPHEMWVRMLIDPVCAAYVIYGVTLDAFQAARLRYYWWVPQLIDSAGVSSGKTFVIWLYVNLRAILIPDQEIAVFYPVYEQGKNTFWNYYTEMQTKFGDRAAVFQAQLGKPAQFDAGDEKGGDGTLHGSACYKAFFKNGNKILMPAPSFMKDAVTQASLRLNVMVIEEWPEIDAMSDGINKQLISRVTRASWNQFHPVWCNHILYSGHAMSLMHPSARRYKAHLRAEKRGDPRFANITSSYKDYSNRACYTGKTFQETYRVESTIEADRSTTSQSEWLGKGFGIWGALVKGLFTEQALLQCRANGKLRHVTPVLSRNQFEQIHFST